MITLPEKVGKLLTIPIETKVIQMLIYNSFLNCSKLNNGNADIGNKIKEYIESLSLNSSELNFYFQRAWATVTKNQGNIKTHRHNQSHISFAYYISLTKDSGARVFLDDDPANQIAPGLFRSKLVRKPSLLNAPEGTIEAKENDIIIFPSKTRHTTKSNQTNKIRISISADIVFTLKI